MIKFKSLSLKNFFSVGQVTQSVNIDEGFVTLVLGDNPDYGEGIRNGVGKAQPLYSKILTPDGWKTMKEIGIGDFVTTPKGTTTVVLGKYPQGKKTIYEIKTKDGKKARACKEHLWNVYIGNDYKTVDTKEIYDAMRSGVYVKFPVIEEVLDKDVMVPFDPYPMGLFLSCGKIVDNTIVFEQVDYDVIHKLKVYMTEDNYELEYKSGNIISRYKHSTQCPLIKFASDTKLLDEKFIPENYFEGSYYQRRDLLMGIHDSRGAQDEDSVITYFKTHEERFARDTQRLSWSVSGVCELKFVTYSIKDKLVGNHLDKDIIMTARYPDSNKLFSLESKKDFPIIKNLCSVIASIKTIEKQEAACIKVADSDSLYITDDYIPTHNTTIINALSYALYGKPITPSKQDHMVNNTNGKNMMVTLDFDVNGVSYRIERGRKPNKLRMLKLDDDGTESVLSDDNEKDRAHGENKETQVEIDNLIEISYLLFKYIIAMNTYSTHFMSAGASEQREVIEQILGIDTLSRKANVLADRIKQTKIDIDKETIRVETIQQSNDRVLRNIENLKNKKEQWDIHKDKTINELVETLTNLGDIDIDKEIENHKHNQELKETLGQIRVVEQELKHYRQNRDRLVTDLTRLNEQLESFQNSICPTCKQEIVDEDEHNKHKDTLTESITSKLNDVDVIEAKIKEYEETLSLIEVTEDYRDTFYKTLEDAYNHKSTMESLLQRVDDKRVEENPYQKQIDDLETGELGLQEIDYQALKDLERKMSHEKFLQKLLTNRDSFVRKRIIDYSLPFLNKVFQKYIDGLSLPHQVVFDPNLTFSITDKGREISFNNLSRGEQNRVTFALNLAFRDLYENLVRPVNCLFVDEILDFGMDTVGAKDGVEILKLQARDLNKAVYLVTHKEELMEHADKTILVKKENGFTTYEHIDS